MRLYVALDSDCSKVLQQIDASADVNLVVIKPRKSLKKDIPTTYPVENEVVNELSGLPALVDGVNVIVGDEIITYLAANPATSSFLVKRHGM